MVRLFQDFIGSRELLANLVRRDVTGQYKRTLLGRLWSLASPLSAMLVYTFVFAFLFRVQPEPGDPSGLDVFALWLLAGLLPWLFFSNALNGAAASLVGNAALITKVYFPRTVLPVATVGGIGYNWLFEMGVLLIALVIVGGPAVLIWVPFTVIAMIVLAVFAIGVGMTLSILNVYFRDTQYLLSIVLQFWMYLTPIIYPPSLVRSLSNDIGPLLGSPITLADLYLLNPMERFVSVFRQLLYDQRIPDGDDIVFCLLAAVISLVIGTAVFARFEKKIGEVL